MPTGYTAKICEGEQSFRDFVLTCARAFGPCIMQRDNPMDEPPMKRSVSGYHTDEIKKAKTKIHSMEDWSSARIDKYNQEEQSKQLKSYQEYLAEMESENSRIAEMIAQVHAWEPPTPDHAELKKFMLDQLTISINSTDWQKKEIKKLQGKAINFWANQLNEAVESIKYHEKQLQEETASVNKSNTWIDALYKSLE